MEDLEVIKTRTFFLKEGERSEKILLVDPAGDMHFTFKLHYTDGKTNETTFTVANPHLAEFVIDTTPNGITRPLQPIEIGTYGEDEKPLFLGFVVQPQIIQSGEHQVLITFYTGKGGKKCQ